MLAAKISKLSLLMASLMMYQSHAMEIECEISPLTRPISFSESTILAEENGDRLPTL